MNTKVCIITLAFGDSRDWYHGASNKALAEQCGTVLRNWNVLKGGIHQWEIDVFLRRNEYILKPLHSITLPIGKKYMDTYEVLVSAKKIMEENGYTDAIFNTHPDHVHRVRLVAKRLGIREFMIDLNRSLIPYDPNSTQWQTCSKARFIFHELMAYIVFLLKGHIRLGDLIGYIF